jgi:NAD:arginine ADP-ribosyltransferase
MGDQYREGNVIQWSGFSSAAVNMDVTTTFVGSQGPRVLFVILLTEADARNIAPFSRFPSEAEALLPPNSAFRIRNILDAGNGLHVVQMLQEDGLDPLIHMSFDPLKG